MVVELFSRQTYRSKLINILCVETHHHFIFKCVFNFVFVSFFLQCFKESQLVSLDPIEQFGNWFEKATKCPEILEANAMCIATATK